MYSRFFSAETQPGEISPRPSSNTSPTHTPKSRPSPSPAPSTPPSSSPPGSPSATRALPSTATAKPTTSRLRPSAVRRAPTSSPGRSTTTTRSRPRRRPTGGRTSRPACCDTFSSGAAVAKSCSGASSRLRTRSAAGLRGRIRRRRIDTPWRRARRGSRL